VSLRGGFVVVLVLFVLGKQLAEISDDIFQATQVVVVEVSAHVMAVRAQLQNDFGRLVGQVFVFVRLDLVIRIEEENIKVFLYRFEAVTSLSKSVD
jgi:hypothetical protein